MSIVFGVTNCEKSFIKLTKPCGIIRNLIEGTQSINRQSTFSLLKGIKDFMFGLPAIRTRDALHPPSVCFSLNRTIGTLFLYHEYWGQT